MNYIICNKEKYEDYYIYHAINNKNRFTSFTSKKNYDTGFILHDNFIYSRKYLLKEKIIILIIMKMISSNLILNYEYNDIYSIINKFLKDTITIKSFMILKLKILKYIGYEIEYKKCFVCKSAYAKYLSLHNWKGLCSNHAKSEYVLNMFQIDIEQSFDLMERYLLEKNIYSQYKIKILNQLCK